MASVGKPLRSRRPVPRRVAKYVTLLALGYLSLAYMLAPEFWTLRDRGISGSFDTLLTRTPQGIPGDPINLGLVGSKTDLIHAFAKAGWHAADELTWRTAIDIGESVVFDRPYADAPVSTLTFDGKPQDLAFELPVGVSPDTRHHVRFWLTGKLGDDGRPLWLGAASFDRGVGLSHDTGQITHHIAPDVDAERDNVVTDLQKAGALISVSTMLGIGPTQDGRNGGGDRYFTDGLIKLCILAPAS